MKYYIIAGEASGDLHGSGIVREIAKQDPDCVIRAWGGDLMKEAGSDLVKHYRDLAFMGFVEVIKNLGTILKNLKSCKRDILEFQPDALILIDYPGFNLSIASWAKKHKIPVFYYISPQIWAWNAKRVHQIKRDVDQMYTILPFEKSFYHKYGYEVTYVGHPLKPVIDAYVKNHSISSEINVIALLPGSRKQEITRILQTFCQLPKRFPEFQFVIAKAPGIDAEFYQKYLSNKDSNITLNNGDTYDLLSLAIAAVSTSGTATLETALFQVPQVVCYHGNPISYSIAKRLIQVPHISLVNLIAEREVVKELIQSEFEIERLTYELKQIISGEKRAEQLDAYNEIHQKLKFKGSPPKLVVQGIIQYLHK